MININKAIASILLGDSELVEKVHSNIYPIFAPFTDEEGVELSFPIILYKRSNMDIEQYKNGVINGVNVEISVYTKTYNEGIELITDVYDIVNNKSGEISGIKIRSMIVQNFNETWVDGIYIQSLIIKIK